jgi:predicted acylesterase/phospholipase RssA
MTTALVISGGGDKGAFAVGAIEVLAQRGYRYDIISGTSTGALIAPLVAIDDIDELVKIYTTSKKRDIIRFNWFGFWHAWYHV